MHPFVKHLLLACIAALLLTAGAIMLTRPAGSKADAPIAARSSGPRPPRPPLSPEPPPLVGTDRSVPTEQLFDQVESILEVSGVRAEDVLSIHLPRRDMLIFLDGNEIPPAAGVRHELLFYRCPCGTLLSHGQFVLLDYEINDVIDALRQDPEVKIAGSAPFLLASEPSLTILRYQAEGDPAHLARILKGALRWVGEARLSSGE